MPHKTMTFTSDLKLSGVYRPILDMSPLEALTEP